MYHLAHNDKNYWKVIMFNSGEWYGDGTYILLRKVPALFLFVFVFQFSLTDRKLICHSYFNCGLK
jgi:hypothetical protein